MIVALQRHFHSARLNEVEAMLLATRLLPRRACVKALMGTQQRRPVSCG